MICCDKCKDKQIATHRVGWSNDTSAFQLAGDMVLCNKCYVEFMILFGNFGRCTQ